MRVLTKAHNNPFLVRVCFISDTKVNRFWMQSAVKGAKSGTRSAHSAAAASLSSDASSLRAPAHPGLRCVGGGSVSAECQPSKSQNEEGKFSFCSTWGQTLNGKVEKLLVQHGEIDAPGDCPGLRTPGSTGAQIILKCTSATEDPCHQLLLYSFALEMTQVLVLMRTSSTITRAQSDIFFYSAI